MIFVEVCGERSWSLGRRGITRGLSGAFWWCQGLSDSIEGSQSCCWNLSAHHTSAHAEHWTPEQWKDLIGGPVKYLLRMFLHGELSVPSFFRGQQNNQLIFPRGKYRMCRPKPTTPVFFRCFHCLFSACPYTGVWNNSHEKLRSIIPNKYPKQPGDLSFSWL